MNEQQLREWIAANGGEKRRQEKQVAVKEYDPATDKEVTRTETQVEIETVNGPTRTFRIKIGPTNGEYAPERTYEQIGSDTGASRAAADREKPTPITPSSTAKKIGFVNPDGTTTWIDNPNYTPEGQQPREPKQISAPANARSLIWQNPDGTIASAPNPNYEGAPTDKPQTVNVGDGEIGQIMPDGTYRVIRPPNPKDPAKQETVVRDGKTFRIVRDAQGNVVREEEVERVERPGGAIPASATGWTPDPNKPAYGLAERFTEYSRRMALPPDDPEHLTREAAKQLYEQDKAVAEVYLGQANNVISTQRDIYGNLVGQRNVDVQAAGTRLSAARGAFDTSLGAVLKLNADLPKGSTAGARGLQALLALQRAEANRYGGLRDYERVPLPPGVQSIYGMDPYGIAGLRPPAGGALESVATHQAPPAAAPPMVDPRSGGAYGLGGQPVVPVAPTAPPPGTLIDPSQIAALQPPPPLDPAVVFGDVLAGAEEEFRQIMGMA